MGGLSTVRRRTDPREPAVSQECLQLRQVGVQASTQTDCACASQCASAGQAPAPLSPYISGIYIRDIARALPAAQRPGRPQRELPPPQPLPPAAAAVGSPTASAAARRRPPVSSPALVAAALAAQRCGLAAVEGRGRVAAAPQARVAARSRTPPRKLGPLAAAAAEAARREAAAVAAPEQTAPGPARPHTPPRGGPALVLARRPLRQPLAQLRRALRPPLAPGHTAVRSGSAPPRTLVAAQQALRRMALAPPLALARKLQRRCLALVRTHVRARPLALARRRVLRVSKPRVGPCRRALWPRGAAADGSARRRRRRGLGPAAGLPAWRPAGQRCRRRRDALRGAFALARAKTMCIARVGGAMHCAGAQGLKKPAAERQAAKRESRASDPSLSPSPAWSVQPGGRAASRAAAVASGSAPNAAGGSAATAPKGSPGSPCSLVDPDCPAGPASARGPVSCAGGGAKGCAATSRRTAPVFALAGSGWGSKTCMLQTSTCAHDWMGY